MPAVDVIQFCNVVPAQIELEKANTFKNNMFSLKKKKKYLI